MRIEYEGDMDTHPSPTIEELRLQTHSELARAKTEAISKMSKTETVAPITEEDVAKEEDEDTPPALPDRALVSKELSQFLKTKKAKVDPLVEQTTRLQEALNELAKPRKELTFEEHVAHKLEAIETRIAQRELEDAQRREQETYDSQLAEYGERVTTFLTSRKDDYPGIVALGRQEAVFNELLSLIDAGQGLSEAEIAKAMEDQIRIDYEKLKLIYEEDGKATNPSKTKKLINSSHGVEKLDPTRFANLKDAQEALWNKVAVRRK